MFLGIGEVRNQPEGPGWDHFWDHLIEAVSYDISIEYLDITAVPVSVYPGVLQRIKEIGCAALDHTNTGSYFDLTGTPYCQGEPGLFRPLAWLCPESCGCSSSGDPERDEFCFGYDHCPFQGLV